MSQYTNALHAQLQDQAEPRNRADQLTGNPVRDLWNAVSGLMPGQSSPASTDLPGFPGHQAATSSPSPMSAPPGQTMPTYGPPGPEQQDTSMQDEQKAKVQKAQADAAAAESNAKIAAAHLAEATSQQAQDAAALALSKAQIDYQRAQIDLAKAQDPNNSPTAVAKLEHDLRLQEQALSQEFTLKIKDAEFAAHWDELQVTQKGEWDRLQAQIGSQRQEGEANRANTRYTTEATLASQEREGAAGRTLTREEGLANRDLRRQEATLTAGVQLRGQEVDRLQAIDKFTTDTIANQIRKGELDVDRGYKVMQSSIQAHRLPSEILSNVGNAIAPFIPHLSSYKEGEIPLGFEAGGPMEIAMKQGGATSYDPSTYAAKPVSVDLFGMAKKMGATPPKGGIPDPNKVIPNVGNIGSGSGSSALSNMPGLQIDDATIQNIMTKLSSGGN